MTPKYPNIRVQLVGMDGNVFAIIGRVQKALKRGGAPSQEASDFVEKAFQARSYDEVLQMVMNLVTVE